jgi:hypothetical protein
VLRFGVLIVPKFKKSWLYASCALFLFPSQFVKTAPCVPFPFYLHVSAHPDVSRGCGDKSAYRVLGYDCLGRFFFEKFLDLRDNGKRGIAALVARRP